MSVAPRHRPDLRLDVPEREAPDHLVEQWATLARQSVPAPRAAGRRAWFAGAVAASLGLVSVGGAWAGGAISLPGVPDSPLVERHAPAPSPTLPAPSPSATGGDPGTAPTSPSSSATPARPEKTQGDGESDGARNSGRPGGEASATRGPGTSQAPGQDMKDERSKGQRGDEKRRDPAERERPTTAPGPQGSQRPDPSPAPERPRKSKKPDATPEKPGRSKEPSRAARPPADQGPEAGPEAGDG